MNFNYALITGPSQIELKRIQSDSIDMVLTSPPYDEVRDYNGYDFNTNTRRLISRQLYRVLKPGGTLVWVVADQTKNGTESGTSFEQALYFKKIGFNLHDTMIYHKKGPPLTHKRYEQAFEYMFVLTKGQPKTFNGLREPKEYIEKKPRKKAWSRFPDGSHKIGSINTEVQTRLKYNVFYYPMGHVAEEKFAYDHPAIFPEDLARDQIYTWSNPGDIVLDPFCGSGTTGKMALNMGRKFIGIEGSAEYVALAKQRIAVNRHKRSIHEEGIYNQGRLQTQTITGLSG